MKKPYGNIWLLAAYGNGNIGDDMLGDVARKTLGAAGDEPKILAGHFYPFDRAGDHGRRSVLSAIGRGDRLLVVGGGLLNDHFGLGFLKYFASLGLALRARGATYSFVGIGVEGFTTKLGALLAKVALGFASSSSVRDDPSLENVRDLGLNSERVPDIGWLARRHLPHDSIHHRARNSVVFTIAVEKEEVRYKREGLLREAILAVLTETNFDVVLVAMQTSEVPALDDRISLQRISDQIDSNRVVVVCPRHYRQLYSLLLDARVVSGYRLHAGLLGAVAGARVVAVSRSPKVREALAPIDHCLVVEENRLESAVEGRTLGSLVLSAANLPQVTESDMSQVDHLCAQIEHHLLSHGAPHHAR